MVHKYAIIYEQASETIDNDTAHKIIKYLSNIDERDHRHIKLIINYMLDFKNFYSVSRIIIGIDESIWFPKSNWDK